MAAAPATACVPEEGAFVRIAGLGSAKSAHLNGEVGEVVNGGLDGESGRIPVLLGNGERVVAVRLANVKPVDDANEPEAQRADGLAKEASECLRRVREEGAGREAMTQAKDALAQAVALDPRCVMAHRVRGDMAHMMGDMQAMVKHFRRAAANGGDVACRVALAGALGSMQDLAGEQAELGKVLLAEPENAHAHLSLAMSLDESGHSDRAIDHALMADQLPPPPGMPPGVMKEQARKLLFRLYYTNAAAKAAQGDEAGARESRTSALTYVDENSECETVTKAAELLRSLGDRDRGRAEAERALRLPGDARTHSYAHHILGGCAEDDAADVGAHGGNATPHLEAAKRHYQAAMSAWPGEDDASAQRISIVNAQLAGCLAFEVAGGV